MLKKYITLKKKCVIRINLYKKYFLFQNYGVFIKKKISKYVVDVNFY